jgi:hypothetical protein
VTRGTHRRIFFAPEFDYGGSSDLRALVDQCHGKGLAVIFDVVYNHVVEADAEDRLLVFDGNTESNGRGIYFSTFDNFGPVPNFDKSAVRDFSLTTPASASVSMTPTDSALTRPTRSTARPADPQHCRTSWVASHRSFPTSS